MHDTRSRSHQLNRLLKKNRRQQARLVTDYNVAGRMSQSGTAYCMFTRDNPVGKKSIDGTPVYVPLTDTGNPKHLCERLTQAGMPLPYRELQDAVVRQAASVRAFERVDLIEHPGFTEAPPVFAF